MKRTEFDEPIMFHIPTNFISKGTILGGTFKVRNAIEAGVILFAFGYPVLKIPMSVMAKIIVMIFCLPIAAIALFGVNNGPLSQFLIDFFKYKKNANTYVYDVNHSFLNENKEKKSRGGKKNEKEK